MKPIHCRRQSYMLAALVGLIVACELPGGSSRESKPKPTSSARPTPAAPKPAEPAEPPPAVENTTAAASVETEAAPTPCAATEFNYPVVKSACSQGGRSAAKKIMQGAIAKAKSAGTELKCANCHVDQKQFGLRPNAVDDLAAWL